MHQHRQGSLQCPKSQGSPIPEHTEGMKFMPGLPAGVASTQVRKAVCAQPCPQDEMEKCIILMLMFLFIRLLNCWVSHLSLLSPSLPW